MNFFEVITHTKSCALEKGNKTEKATSQTHTHTLRKKRKRTKKQKHRKIYLRKIKGECVRKSKKEKE